MENTSPLTDQLRKDLHLVNDNVQEILNCLRGNSRFDKNDDGIIGELRRMNLRVSRLEKWKDRAVYVMIGASAGAGATVWQIIQNIIHK